jgi:hypothetical protein
VEALIDLAESLVQANAAIGGPTDDAPMIEIVQSRAADRGGLRRCADHRGKSVKPTFSTQLRPRRRQRPRNRC